MIVDSMNYAEIAKEISHDVHNVEVAANRIGYDKKYRKPRLTSSNRGNLYFKEVELTSANKNHVLVFPHSPSRKHFLEYGFVYAIPIWFCRYRGQFLAVSSAKALTESVADIQIFTEHFFQRYNERCLHEPGLSVEEVARKFFRCECEHTSIRSVMDPKTKREEKICAFKNGCSFVEIGGDYDYFIHRTFVSSEMLFATQNKDLFQLEAINSLANLHSHGTDDFLVVYSHYRNLLEPHFEYYSLLHSMVKVNHQMHPSFQAEAQRLYDLLDEVWRTTHNTALLCFGNHLLEIAHAASPIEVEKLLSDEGNKFMR